MYVLVSSTLATSCHHALPLRLCQLQSLVPSTHGKKVQTMRQLQGSKVVYTRGSHVRIQGSKWNQAIDVHFRSWSRDRDELWATNINQSTHLRKY